MSEFDLLNDVQFSKRILFTRHEKEILMTLLSKYKHILDNRRNDASSILVKRKCWEDVGKEFNCQPGVTQRSVSQLQKCWDNLKARHKKLKASQEVTSATTKELPKRIPLTDEELMNIFQGSVDSGTDGEQVTEGSFHEDETITSIFIENGAEFEEEPEIEKKVNENVLQTDDQLMSRPQTINSNDTALEIIKEIVRPPVIKKSKKDEFSVFGDYVASELRTMKDPFGVLMTKKRIQDVIFEAKMKLFKTANPESYERAASSFGFHADS